MTIRVNGGIINKQTLTGGLRYFKMVAPGVNFAWAVSDGTVNLPVFVNGGDTPTKSYFRVGNDDPVPGSAVELALREISKQCDIVIISCQPALYASTTAVHFACSASAFGWGSGTPAYEGAIVGEDPTAAAPAMQVAVRLLPNATVYITAATQATTPVTATAVFTGITVTEVPFALA